MNKLGVIVPYRDRHEHLVTWTREVKHFLNSKNINYNIIIVEQDNSSAFNRGMLCNIGFQNAVKRGCNYVVFHDVDMIPVDVDYSYSNTPVHLFNDQLDFDSYFGGMTMFTVEDFKKINGFSNLYWGWGFEDDDLRYRCALHSINIGSPVSINEDLPRETAVFNGKNSIATLPNTLKFNTDLSIEIVGRLDHVEMDPEKEFDQYTLLSIKGSDFRIYFNSYNRFVIETYDKEYDKYTLTSDIFNESSFNIRFEYNTRLKNISLFLNDKLQDTLTLKRRIYDYSKSHIINIGADTDNVNFFHGAIDKIVLYTRKGKIISKYLAPNKEKYVWIDSIRRERGTLDNIDIRPFTTPSTMTIDSIIPHRREGSIYKLNHSSNGYIGGRWRSDLTRWNQLRYNNEVKRGVYNNTKDGLKDCEYILHSKFFKDKVLHLNVGI